MMSVMKSFIGVGTAIYPMMVRYLLSEFKYRGAVAIIAALNAHAILAMVLLHPVEWHSKVVQVPVEESIPRNEFINWFQLFYDILCMIIVIF